MIAKVMVPKLRFKNKNGGDFPDWSDKLLENICATFKSGQGITSEKISRIGHYPVFGGNGLRGFTDTFTHDGVYVLIGRQGALCGNINKSSGKTFISEHAIAVQANETSDTNWLGYKLDLMKLNRLSESSAQPGLSVGKLLKISLTVPPKAEQTKIANFLTAVDAKISQLTKKHELLTSYKKGVMQKIFSQELRFKDESGEYFPAWKIVRLSEIAEFFRGGQLAKSHLNINGENLCIHYGELFTVYAETISTVKSRTNISDGFIGYAGDIVMPSSDVTPDGLARASCLLIDRVILGGDMNIIRPIKTVDPAMLSYLLNFDKKKVIDLVSGTTVKHIYIKDIKGIELAIPRSLNEQSAISTFLIELDKKIQIVKLQIELSKKYKQGLLQQMFV